MINPSGAIAQRVIGVTIITIKSGFKKLFDHSGVIRSTGFSTYFKSSVDNIAGIIEDD